MSKANEQSLALISAIAACYYHLYSKRYFARVDIHRLCEAGYIGTIAILTDWPEMTEKVNDKAIEAIKKWKLSVGEDDDELASQTLVFIISRIVIDLQSMIRNKKKLSLIETLNDSIIILEEFVDPEGRNTVAYDAGNELIEELYKIIEWDWDKMPTTKREIA